MSEYKIRRTCVTETMVRNTYDAVRRLGRPTTLDLRRAMPFYCTTTIQKSLGELKDRGWVQKDKDWPPRYMAVDKEARE